MKIALTYTGNDKKHRYYADWLAAGDGEIEVLRFAADANPPDVLQRCDALVLSGGLDIHPVFYSGNTEYPHQPEEGWDKNRDQFEIALFKQAEALGIPLLAICRGLQVINVALGGTMVQDLGDDRLNKIHMGGPDKQHAVYTQKGSLLHQVAGMDSGEVNSAHHQAIDKLGKDLKINCRAPDETPEGIEWLDRAHKPFMLAVQWHPERMFRMRLQDSPLSKGIRDRFIEEIKRAMPGKG